MTNGVTCVGLDAHKESIQVAMLVPGQREPLEWQLANEPQAVRRLAKKLLREAPEDVVCCYEAGPCGYALQWRRPSSQSSQESESKRIAGMRASWPICCGRGC